MARPLWLLPLPLCPAAVSLSISTAPLTATGLLVCRCMHDEASPFYTEMIDQTTRGHQFLKKNFGDSAIPRGTWQIDPFGHSNTEVTNDPRSTSSLQFCSVRSREFCS